MDNEQTRKNPEPGEVFFHISDLGSLVPFNAFEEKRKERLRYALLQAATVIWTDMRGTFKDSAGDCPFEMADAIDEAIMLLDEIKKRVD